MSLSENPPVKSWDLEFHSIVAAFKKSGLWELPIEQAQKQFVESSKIEVPSNIIIDQVILDERYRQESRKHLEKGLKKYEDVLDEKWKEPNDKLHGEWAQLKAIELLHLNTQSMLKLEFFNQFPASLCDSVAAYLYLLDPGLDAGFKPINPKKIVFVGESAGGGLALATLLFLRDTGLPLPGGAVVLSPWVDLTQSMPSFWNAELDKVDIVPRELGVHKIEYSSPVADEFIVNAKALSDKIAQKKPTIVGHSSFTEVPRIHLYCANEALAIPYVSPMLAESLGDLPPILCQVGELERARDEGILLSHKAAFPHEYQLPSYATKNFEKSPFKNPTKVILEVYDDMPHYWQVMSSSKPSQIAIKRCGEFINRVTSVEDNNSSIVDLLKEDVSPSISISPSFIAMKVNTNGEVRELNKTDRDCLKWARIGVFVNLGLGPRFLDGFS
ncbi:2362_t:CDS:2 [Dentiscutata erythropus]|uniref:2362_t:CDS:1 n=1 Tax=Dentiscutata erythropus TaxID=1348616 RepID=A0A9N9ESH1_9GLOM|nr:2362_t:CDS:2 [Dentiscutata erythropus]